MLRKVLTVAAVLTSTAFIHPAFALPEFQNERIAVTSTSPSRSFLGVGVIEITAERAKALKLKEERGIEVTKVVEGSPAEKAGVKVGDVVTEYNGQRVEGAEQFVRFVHETPAGRVAKLQVFRGGQMQTLTATLESRATQTLQLGDMRVVIPAMPAMPALPSLPPSMPRAIMTYRSAALG
ncbi:MAG: PDZ domain-containing protein, partial [Candidatus Solibacter usitatus]|nr:PDZ domain-containing protein [Candidatus Solibacter usitatus]